MRVFIAIEIDEQTKKQLNSIQDNIKNYVNKGNYTSRDNSHITLRFIGDADEGELNRLKQAIDGTASKARPFTLSLAALGHFPRKQKEIIWVGVKGQLDYLKELKQGLEDELDKVGYTKEEREYNPHITLVRQATLDKSFDMLKEEVSVPNAEMKIKNISLMESTRIDGELVYRSIYKKLV